MTSTFAPRALVCLSVFALVGCSVAPSGPTSSEAAASVTLAPSSPPSTATSVAPSVVPTPTAVPPDFTVSWTQMPWSGRVTGLSYDAELGLWMAFGSQEMWTSPDGATWQRHAFQGEDLGEGCPDPQPARMIDAVRMGDRLWAAGTWDNDCDLLALLMWSSTDGATWVVVPQGTRDGFSAHGIDTNGSKLAIATTDFAEGFGEVITSGTGSGWTSHLAGTPAAMLDVYGDADGFAAVGYRYQGTGHAPAIWASENGSVWTDASPDNARGRLRSVVRGADGAYLATGLDENASVQIWRSEDGLNWAGSRLPSPGVATGAVWPEIRLVATSNRIVLIADTVIGWWFWTSNDGQRWSAGRAIPAEGGSYFGPMVAMSGDRVVAFLDEPLPGGVGSHLVVGQIVPSK